MVKQYSNHKDKRRAQCFPNQIYEKEGKSQMTIYNGKEMLEGLIFMKSMMSKENVENHALSDAKRAFKAGIHCGNLLLDDSYSRSVDRGAVLDLLEYLATGKYSVLVVENIYDITTDAGDLKAMIDRINGMDVIIFELSTMTARFNNYAKEC